MEKAKEMLKKCGWFFEKENKDYIVYKNDGNVFHFQKMSHTVSFDNDCVLDVKELEAIIAQLKEME